MSEMAGNQVADIDAIFQEQLSETIHEIQRNLLNRALIGYFIVGLVLLGSFQPPFNQPVYFVTSLCILALVVGIFFLQRWNYGVSVWLVVAVGTISLCVLIFYGAVWDLLALFLIPAGLAALLISPTAGLIFSICFSIVLLAFPWTSELSGIQKVVALFATWGTVGMVIYATQPLLMAVHWSWEGFQRNRVLLTQAQDFQVRLQETLVDLSSANTRLTRLNKRIEGLHLAAEEARQAKEQFVANISHELRTPINMIIGYCEMIIESPQMYGKNLPPALLSDLTVIHRNSQHLSSLINDVLDLSQLESGQMALNRERANLSGIIEAAITAIQPLFVSKKLFLQVEMQDALPTIYCDVVRIREVMLNLLSNSGRFTEKGGVTVRAHLQDNNVVVSVSDTGLGIAKDDQVKLFQPFEQLDGTIRRRHGGSGLGLSISKKFVELHDGRMWLESTPGKGTTFFFSLPITPHVPVEATAARWITPGWDLIERTYPSMAQAATIHPRYLILEKGEALAKIVERYMDQVEVVRVSTEEDALTELGRVPSQVFLINNMNDPAVLEYITNSPQFQPEIPLILTNIPSNEEASTKLGVDAYLTKPTSVQALKGVLRYLNEKGRNILLVDDDEDELRLYWRILSQAGKKYKIMTAENGKQALEILQTNSIDLLVVDLVMPEMDGFQLLKICSQDPNLQQIPTVVISALDPLGHPLISNTLTVTRKGGISIPQLLHSIEAISHILGPRLQ